MKFFKYLIPLLLAASFASGEVLDATKEGTAGTGSEGPIENSSAPSTIDNHIRQNLQQWRKRLEVEHHVGSGDGTADDHGAHRVGSARCYIAATAPTSLNDSQTSANIALYDNSQESSGTGAEDFNDLMNNAASAAENDVGHGRCWIDTSDNNRLWIYVGVAGDDTPSTIAEGWQPTNQITGTNLLSHSSFEGTDGDGDVDATGIPLGWTATAGPATYLYNNISEVTEGVGFALRTTTGAAATDDGVQQTIGGLHPSTQYRFSVRAHAATGDTCQLAVTGHDSVIPSAAEDETTTEDWETLELLVTTNATPSDLVFILRGPDNSDVCDWAHPTVVQVNEMRHPNSGPVVFSATATGNVSCASQDYTAASCNALATIEVTPPGPGYYAIITGSVYMNITDGGNYCSARLFDGTNQLEEAYINPSGSTQEMNVSVRLTHITTTTLVAGTTVNYVLQAQGEDANACDVFADTTPTELKAILIPGS